MAKDAEVPLEQGSCNSIGVIEMAVGRFRGQVKGKARHKAETDPKPKISPNFLMQASSLDTPLHHYGRTGDLDCSEMSRLGQVQLEILQGFVIVIVLLLVLDRAMSSITSTSKSTITNERGPVQYFNSLLAKPELAA